MDDGRARVRRGLRNPPPVGATCGRPRVTPCNLYRDKPAGDHRSPLQDGGYAVPNRNSATSQPTSTPSSLISDIC
ncbi:MAG: hypothetical protein LBM98_01235 [Oscillospiraceae bacterium]|nr:hypothetical protein [Oscillospiraceae bacterium]